MLQVLTDTFSCLQSKAIASAAAEAATAVLTHMNPNGVRLVLPMLFDAMNQKQKWQTKVGALQQLGALTKIAPAQMKAALPDIVPAVGGCFADAKPQVKVSYKLSRVKYHHDHCLPADLRSCACCGIALWCVSKPGV
jgi:hypothetical protein